MLPPEIASVFSMVIINYNVGHDAEISKAVFNPQGTKILTASADNSAIIWSAGESGK